MKNIYFFIIFSFLSLSGLAKTTESVSDGNWNDASTWSNGVPAAGDIVVVHHDVTLNRNFNIDAGSLTIEAGASLIKDSNNRNINMWNAAARLTNHGTLEFHNLDGNGIINNTGTLTMNRMNSLYSNGQLINSGTFTALRVELSGSTVFENTGTFTTTATANPSFEHSGDSFINTGTLSTHNLELSDLSTVTNSASGTLTIGNDLTTTNSDFDNEGVITAGGLLNYSNNTLDNNGSITAGELQFNGTANLNNAGSLLSTSNVEASLGFYGDTFTNSGSVSTYYFEGSATTISNTPSGTITTTDEMDLTDTDFTNEGSVAVGDEFSYNGNGVGSNSGTFNIGADAEFWGTTNFSNYTTINVTGIVEKSSSYILNNGTINVSGGEFHNYDGTVTSTTCGYINTGNSYTNYGGATTSGNLTICGTMPGWANPAAPSVTFTCDYSDPCNIPLPVTLLNFSGEQDGEQVVLQWEIAQTDAHLAETYTVELAYEDLVFRPVKAFTHQAGKHSYQTSDPVRRFGNLYYRLKVTESGNVVQYSKVICVSIRALKQILPPYPNPLKKDKQTLFIPLAAKATRSLHVELFHTSGKLSKSQSVQYNPLEGGLYLKLNDLSQGI